MDEENYIVNIDIHNAENLSIKPLNFSFDFWSEKDIYDAANEIMTIVMNALEEKGYC